MCCGRWARSDQLAQSSIRFSLGRFTTEDDIDRAVAVVSREVTRLRALAPASAQPIAFARSEKLITMEPEYSATVVDHFEHPRNGGHFEAGEGVIEGTAGSVAQGHDVQSQCAGRRRIESKRCASKRTAVLIASPPAPG